MKIRLTVEVDDNFTKGDCYNCPFAYEDFVTDEYDGGWELRYPLMECDNDCPLEVIEDD